MFKFNAKFDADSLLSSLSHFEWMATQYTRSLTQQHLPPPLTSTGKSSLFMLCIPVHSPGLSGYLSVAQTVLITLTMARLFPDRPHICFVEKFVIP